VARRLRATASVTDIQDVLSHEWNKICAALRGRGPHVLHEQSEQRASELEALYRAAEQIYRSLRLDEVLDALVEVATDLLQPDKVAVGMLEDGGERIVVGAARGFSAATVAESV
jgi:hypothetical protein